MRVLISPLEKRDYKLVLKVKDAGEMLIEPRKISEQLFSDAYYADDLFCNLSPEAEKALRALKREKKFAAGETIFASGQKPNGIYLLVEGGAEILYQGFLPVHSVRENEILGLTETISNLPSETSLKTTAPSRFETIRRDDFLRFLQNEPATCFRLLQTIGASLHRLYQIFR